MGDANEPLRPFSISLALSVKTSWDTIAEKGCIDIGRAPGSLEPEQNVTEGSHFPYRQSQLLKLTVL
jgi:hypothetical protein